MLESWNYKKISGYSIWGVCLCVGKWGEVLAYTSSANSQWFDMWDPFLAAFPGLQ